MWCLFLLFRLTQIIPIGVSLFVLILFGTWWFTWKLKRTNERLNKMNIACTKNRHPNTGTINFIIISKNYKQKPLLWFYLNEFKLLALIFLFFDSHILESSVWIARGWISISNQSDDDHTFGYWKKKNTILFFFFLIWERIENEKILDETNSIVVCRNLWFSEKPMKRKTLVQNVRDSRFFFLHNINPGLCHSISCKKKNNPTHCRMKISIKWNEKIKHKYTNM